MNDEETTPSTIMLPLPLRRTLCTSGTTTETRIGARAKVGNFVELKKTELGEGSKAPHLSYLGDATIGTGVNIGAGTITCNYDGVAKHPTRIEDGAFVGSNSTLVAPAASADRRRMT